MLYHEFVDGTGCRDNDYNYNLYKELEIIYMNTNCSKAHIYEMGKKLVDNSKSEKELKLEAEVKAEIESLKDAIENEKRMESFYKAQKEYNKSIGDKFWTAENRRMERYHAEEIKKLRTKIKILKWLLSTLED